MMKNKTNTRRILRVLIALLILVLALGVAFLLYASQYYRADEQALHAMQGSEIVRVVDKGDWVIFDGPGTERAYIFYPGAKVQAEAYAPMLLKLAEDGLDSYLVRMPYRLAFLGMDRADAILASADADVDWYIGGHSLGGAMAAVYASQHMGEFEGAILMASYPTKSLNEEGFGVLSLYGREDGVLNTEKLVEGRAYMPRNYVEVCLEGGNHAQFGAYGVQKGDGIATISGEEQQSQIADAVKHFLENR